MAVSKKNKEKSSKKVLKKALKKAKTRNPLTLSKPRKNPIIKPKPSDHWRSKATFNPTAIYHDDRVHIIYRAIGDDDESVLGYASSKDGLIVDDGFDGMIYRHKKGKVDKKLELKIFYSSGGGWGGGTEDPRITLLDNRIYLIYTAFDGWGSIRVALSSISLDDFVSRRWNWKDPVLISPPGEIHKNWVLFPDKIRGRYAILHSISPEIMIEYFDSLNELDGQRFIRSTHQSLSSWMKRGSMIRGVGPSPIKTKYGWLVLYHAMEERDTSQYKLWAMILDLDHPERVIYRGAKPILEPNEYYENEGFKSGVVYSCGAVVKGNKLFVYYGGADMVSCVATADLNKFLRALVAKKNAVVNKTSKVKLKAD